MEKNESTILYIVVTNLYVQTVSTNNVWFIYVKCVYYVIL